MSQQTTDSTEPTRLSSRWSFARIIGGLAAVVGIIAGGLGVLDYVQGRPSYDLSGEWHLTNTIETTTFRPFQGLRVGYRLNFRQKRLEIEGTGEKWSENGINVPSTQHTPIDITGAINGRQITGTFRERGARRETSGTFEWTIDASGQTMTGRFTSTAADAGGPSTVERVAK